MPCSAGAGRCARVLRKRDLKPGKLRYGVYTGDGAQTCSDGTPLDYVRTDADTGCYVYRLSDDCLGGGGGWTAPGARCSRSVKGYRVCGDEVWVDPQADVRLFGYPYRWDNPEWREFNLMRGSGEDVFGVERRISFGAALLSWRGEGASPGVADGDNVAGHRAAEFIAGIGAVACADDSLAAAAWSIATAR